MTFETIPEAITLLLEKVDRIETLLSEQPGFLTDDLLNIKDAAKFLDLSVATVYSKICRRELPVNKKGKRIYFYRSELTDWIRKGRMQTVDELSGAINSNKNSREKYKTSRVFALTSRPGAAPDSPRKQ